MGVWRIGAWLGGRLCRITTTYPTLSARFVAIFGLLWSFMGVDLCRIRWRSTSQVDAGGGRGYAHFFSRVGARRVRKKIIPVGGQGAR
jgi:hypothetical protein